MSSAALTALNAAQTGEVFLVLVTIEVPDAQPIYMTANSEDIVSRGRTYLSYPFSLETPSDENGQISEARLSIDNVSRSLIDEIRNLSDPLQLSIEVVLASSPDTVEAAWHDYILRQVSYDALTISGTLTQENFLNEPFPKDVMSASLFPGQF